MSYGVDGKARDAIAWRLIVSSVDTEEDATHYAEWLSIKYPKNVYRLYKNINSTRIIIASFMNGKRGNY